MKLIKIVFLIFLSLNLASCRYTRYREIMESAIKAKLADPNPNPVFDGEVEPPIPNPSENDRTIMGIDSNNNGIRDDIDIWINRNALNSNERRAFRQLAKAMTDHLIVLSSIKEIKSFLKSEELDKKIYLRSRAIACNNSISLPLRGGANIVKLGRNSPDNILWWLVYNSTDSRESKLQEMNKMNVYYKTLTDDEDGNTKVCNFSIEK